MTTTWRGSQRVAATLSGLAAIALATAGCSTGGSTSAATCDQPRGATITVALSADKPPQAALDAFTQETGIKVNWVNIDWDSLQTKISAAAAANTYFADATNVDWSRVGQLGELGWFLPLEDHLDTAGLQEDVPQLNSFMSGGHVVGIPYDASFMVTTVNTDLFKQAGVSEMPTTIEEYTNALKQVQTKGVAKHPLNIPFAAAEGLSTYWYETTAAMGGTVLDGQGKPQFADPSSPGYKAATWMVDAMSSGLVPPGNINTTDSQGQQTLMAQGQVASTFSDYSGQVGTLYDLKDMSRVVDQVQYIPTPGVDGPGPNLSNPDGIGIPEQAKCPAAAAKFIEWFTSAEMQEDFIGLNGQDKVWPSYYMPSHLSVVQEMADSGSLAQGEMIADLLKDAQPVFPQGAPTWYPEFSNAVYTSLHAAAAGDMSVDDAIAAIAAKANELSSSQ